MQPINAISIASQGNSDKRIGPNKRNSKLDDSKLERLENMIIEMSPLATTCDVRSIHPPEFMEFCYHDMIGGLNVTTLSAEITARAAVAIARRPATGKFPFEETMDKYDLRPPEKTYNKVIFLAGSNSHNLIDQSRLQALMTSDKEWMIKLHPVTNDDTVRALAGIFGYHRLIDRNVSGHSLLMSANHVATMQTSELFVLARYMGKRVIDLTRFDRAWLCAYHHICRLFTGDNERDKELLDRLFTAEGCGHLRVEHSDEQVRANLKLYFDTAMELRRPFEMIVNQKLNVADRTFTNWQ